MANSPVIQTFVSQLGIKKESTPGTYVAPSTTQDFMYGVTVKLEDIIFSNLDESYQGVAAKTIGFFPGFRYAKITIEGPFSQLASGNLLMAAMGTDNKTGAGDPFTHTITLLNTGAAPSYSISWFDGSIATTRAVENAYLQELNLSYATQGLFKNQAVFIGKYVDVAQTKPTATYDTAPHYIPYENALTLNSVANGRLITFDMKIAREVEPIFGSTGTQDISAISQGRMTVKGKLGFVVVDATDINYYRNNTQPTFSALLTNTASHTLTIQMTKCAFDNGTVIDYGSPYEKVMANYEGVYNATDGGPVKFVLLNALSTAY